MPTPDRQTDRQTDRRTDLQQLVCILNTFILHDPPQLHSAMFNNDFDLLIDIILVHSITTRWRFIVKIGGRIRGLGDLKSPTRVQGQSWWGFGGEAKS